MCATVIWALRAEMLDDAFRAMTLERLGVEPQPTPFTVASKRVGADAETFTLTRRMCDCDGVVGLRGREQVDGETPAAPPSTGSTPCRDQRPSSVGSPCCALGARRSSPWRRVARAACS